MIFCSNVIIISCLITDQRQRFKNSLFMVNMWLLIYSNMVLFVFYIKKIVIVLYVFIMSLLNGKEREEMTELRIIRSFVLKEVV